MTDRGSVSLIDKPCPLLTLAGLDRATGPDGFHCSPFFALRNPYNHSFWIRSGHLGGIQIRVFGLAHGKVGPGSISS